MRARAVAAAAFAATLALAPQASAQPQATVGLVVGAAGVSHAPQLWQSTQFDLGLHGDVIFLRKGNGDFGIGPFVEANLRNFAEFEAGGGGSLVVPVLDAAPVVLSGGGYVRAPTGQLGAEPGLSGQLFWGARSHNYESWYGMTGGVVGQVRASTGASHELTVLIAAQIDVEILALPFLLLVNAGRGGTGNTPVR